jgi:hypothetical protein
MPLDERDPWLWRCSHCLKQYPIWLVQAHTLRLHADCLFCAAERVLAAVLQQPTEDDYDS